MVGRVEQAASKSSVARSSAKALKQCRDSTAREFM
jgi:hypothetical protein